MGLKNLSDAKKPFKRFFYVFKHAKLLKPFKTDLLLRNVNIICEIITTQKYPFQSKILYIKDQALDSK